MITQPEIIGLEYESHSIPPAIVAKLSLNKQFLNTAFEFRITAPPPLPEGTPVLAVLLVTDRLIKIGLE